MFKTFGEVLVTKGGRHWSDSRIKKRKWKSTCFIYSFTSLVCLREIWGKEKVNYVTWDKTWGLESSWTVVDGTQVKWLRSTGQHVKLAVRMEHTYLVGKQELKVGGSELWDKVWQCERERGGGDAGEMLALVLLPWSWMLSSASCLKVEVEIVWEKR